MEDTKKILINWLRGEPSWVQALAKDILESGAVTGEVVYRAYSNFKSDEGKNMPEESLFSLSANDEANQDAVKLVSIGDIKGIDELAPRVPLNFDDKLTVIYGLNGAGKSGYTRILKKVCGKPGAVDLVSNVYRPEPNEKGCTFTVKVGEKESEIEWEANSQPVSLLEGVDIFDSKVGEIYLESELGVSYLPMELFLMESLVKVFGQIKINLENEKVGLKSKLPTRPLNNSKYTKGMYENLKHNTDITEVERFYSFTKQDAETLKKLEEKLKSSPEELAKKKRKRKSSIESLLSELSDARKKIDSESSKKIFDSYSNLQEKKKASEEGARAIKDISCLDGVGSETWKAMWTAAKKFSISSPYLDEPFPYIEENSRCVLCQQELKDDTKERLQKFEGFVTGELEQELKNSQKAYSLMIEQLPTGPNSSDLKTKLLASQLDEEVWLPIFEKNWEKISSGVETLKEAPSEKFKGVDDFKDEFKVLYELCISLEVEAVDHDQDGKDFDKPEIEQKITDLKAKQWCSGYIETMKEEVTRLKAVSLIEDLIKLVDTRRISKKAGELSEKLITKAYIERFNEELKQLGAKNVKVELVKTRVSQGQVKHKVQLHGLSNDHKKIKTKEILSEGERRIVSLASFLADVTGKEVNTPFVFDDPITSMDQIYEENTVKRLIKLSEERQVIVFTHRLSMLGLFDALGKPLSKYIRREAWGCGEHSELPLSAKRPASAIKQLRDKNLAQARKALNNEGQELYSILAKAICSDFRILLERVVEVDFFADVVRRHRRSIETKGKLKNLSKITDEDCSIIDRFMTKYSSYEHSQSDEAPIIVIQPEELEQDFEEILKWHQGFISR